MSNTSSLETNRTNEQKVIVADFKDVTLKVDYFWDEHGNLINWNECVHEPVFWQKANVKIRRYSFTENLLGKAFDFSTLQLIVNDEFIPGEVLDYKLENSEDNLTLCCKLVVGWG